jgi:hypothetical protein
MSQSVLYMRVCTKSIQNQPQNSRFVQVTGVITGIGAISGSLGI